MQRVLLLTGNAGVGKTTAARAWANQHGGAAITGDDIYLWMRVQNVRRRDFHQELSISRIVVQAITSFLDLGLDVAADYVWRPDTLCSLRDQFAKRADVQAIRLRCKLHENQRRNGSRAQGKLPDDTIQNLAAELESFTWPDFVHTIDTDDLQVNEVFVKIENTFTR